MSVLVILSILFFALYSYFSYGKIQEQSSTGESLPYFIFNQPDEGINYFFTRTAVFENTWGKFEPYAEISDNQVHPRSVTVVHNTLVPIGFPGFIAFLVVIAKVAVYIFGPSAFHFVILNTIPLIGAMTPLLAFLFFKKIFDDRVSFGAAVLLYFFPAWWYLSTRPLQYMVLFVFLFFCGLVFGATRFKVNQTASTKKSLLYLFLSGLCFGADMVLRPSEIVWMCMFFIFLFVWTLNKITWSDRIFFVLGILCMAGIGAYVQFLFYGSPFATGYVKPASDGSAGSALSFSLFHYFFPFGIHPKNMLISTWAYLVKIFSAWSIFALAGALVVLKQKSRTEFHKKYFLVFVLVTIFLVTYYGSWNFADNLAGKTSLGSSQIRYFLIIYIFALPFVAMFFENFFWARNKKWSGGVCMFLLFVVSYNSVFTSFEGIDHINTTTKEYAVLQEKIVALTEPNSVVVTSFGDKYVFPARKVMTGFTSQQEIEALKTLTQKGIPVYFYDLRFTFLPWQEVGQYLPVGFELSDPLFTSSDSELRKVVKGVEK